MSSWLPELLFALQLFHVLFLALHDWVPLGRFNDVTAVRDENPRGKLLFATAMSTVPFAALLWRSFLHLHGPVPSGLLTWLWIAYGLLFAGELNAWWVPYFFGAKPERAARYRKMFGRTHAFLPERNDIQPNTLHVALHAMTLLTLVVLAVVTLHHN